MYLNTFTGAALMDGEKALEVDAGADFDPLRLDHQLCFPLYAATNLIQRLYRPLLAPLGLTYSQYLVMLVLWERTSVNVSDLRACLHLDNGTVTPLLKRMERAGFVTRRRDADDERRVIVALTPLGAALHDRARAIPTTLASRLPVAREDGEALHSLATGLVSRVSAALAES
jgi:DNA-binding MarR family transcriptional regulator